MQKSKKEKLTQKRLKKIKDKKCSKCGEVFPATAEFWYCKKDSKDGFIKTCKVCKSAYESKYRVENKEKRAERSIKYRAIHKDKISEKAAKYYIENKEKRAEYQAKYNVENKDKISKNAVKYRAENKKKLSEKAAEYRAENKEKAAEYRAENKEKAAKYRAENKNKLSEYHKEKSKSPVRYKIYAQQLSGIEEIRRSKEIDGVMDVKCAYCGAWFSPDRRAVQLRIRAINNTGGGRLYCSDGCKHACPSYRQHNYPKGFRIGTSREVLPELRQMVFEYDNYTCQRCHITIKDAQLHAHHIKGAVKEPMLANDITNVITLCKTCHKMVHSQDGCKYIDYRRAECVA